MSTTTAEVHLGHGRSEARHIDILWDLVQKLAHLAFGACPAQPETAEGAFQVMAARLVSFNDVITHVPFSGRFLPKTAIGAETLSSKKVAADSIAAGRRPSAHESR
jgi:hypothetical protein